jgi:hypothetical protein
LFAEGFYSLPGQEYSDYRFSPAFTIYNHFEPNLTKLSIEKKTDKNLVLARNQVDDKKNDAALTEKPT